MGKKEKQVKPNDQNPVAPAVPEDQQEVPTKPTPGVDTTGSNDPDNNENENK